MEQRGVKTISFEDLKKHGIPEIELIEAWNLGNLDDSCFPTKEVHVLEDHRNRKWLPVASLNEDGVFSDDDLQARFPGWDQYLIHPGVHADAPDEETKQTRSVIANISGRSLLVISGDVSFRVNPVTSGPPKTAMYLLFLLPRAQREVVQGDIAEMYSTRREKLGAFRCYLWLYKEVGLSLWPLVKQALASLRKRTYRFYM